ncbi:hypothetical protein FBEOM_13536 [Fusarium beomiforme]|uniref:Uncharacterized protein n=1 Tax=Fusarium beomiforme TaxID=44412 RepID=A0A9P5DRH3_9HYPO|nr:hypothetical protein FBEOM_13536 [Fusarium beomiforme]
MSSKEYVQKYLWRDHGQPLQTAWQITLTDNEAIAFLALTTTLLAYTQTRAWVLARLAVIKLTRPIRLSDEDEPGSLNKLTQKDAMVEMFVSAAPRVFGRYAPRHNQMSSVSLWFGVVAMINIVIFFALSAVIPWALTGGLETPIVQSKTWDGCHPVNGSSYSDRGGTTADRAANIYRRCWFNTTGILDSCGRQNGIIFDRPTMHISQDIACPFVGAACHPNVRPIRLEHVNITLRDFGLNLKSSLLFSSRLTCTPLNLDHFITDGSGNTTWLQVSDQKLLQYPPAHEFPNFRKRLSYPDGRGPRPNDTVKFFWPERTPGLLVWLTQYGDFDLEGGQSHGEVLVLVYDAGLSRYSQSIDDPIYSAHVREFDVVYWPDYEYTMMGCLEQHRICVSGSPSICTRYGTISDAMFEIMYQKPRLPADQETIYDELRAIHEYGDLGSVHHFLTIRGASAMRPTIDNSVLGPFEFINSRQQWIRNVKAWFETSLLDYRLYLLANLAEDGRFGGLKKGRVRENLCGHVLFLDGDFTNINFLGLIITLVFIVIITGCSHAERLTKATTHTKEFFYKVFETLSAKTKAISREIKTAIRDAFLYRVLRTLSAITFNNARSTPELGPGQTLTHESELERSRG